MAACGLIPAVTGLSPMEASSLAHAEAQFIGKRVAMLGLADGPNLLLEVSMASRAATQNWIATLHAAGYPVEAVFAEISAVFAEISIAESIGRCDAAHRHGEEELRRGRGYGGRYIPADAIQALADTPDGAIAGTFDDVVHAYDQGALTAADYTVLVHAATQARRSTGGSP